VNYQTTIEYMVLKTTKQVSAANYAFDRIVVLGRRVGKRCTHIARAKDLCTKSL